MTIVQWKVTPIIPEQERRMAHGTAALVSYLWPDHFFENKFFMFPWKKNFTKIKFRRNKVHKNKFQ